MAIHYQVRPCSGNRYGVYVRSLSRAELSALAYKMPELKQLIPDYVEYSSSLLGAMPIVSGRIARKPTEHAARKFISRIKAEPIAQQIERLKKLTLYASPQDKDFVLVKAQYYQLYRDIHNKEVKLQTSQNKVMSENMALRLNNRNVNTRLHKSIGKTIKIRKQDEAKIKPIIEELDMQPQGAMKGFTKPIKDQTQEFTQRISQKRKNTTKLTFWKNR